MLDKNDQNLVNYSGKQDDNGVTKPRSGIRQQKRKLQCSNHKTKWLIKLQNTKSASTGQTNNEITKMKPTTTKLNAPTVLNYSVSFLQDTCILFVANTAMCWGHSLVMFKLSLDCGPSMSAGIKQEGAGNDSQFSDASKNREPNFLAGGGSLERVGERTNHCWKSHFC